MMINIPLFSNTIIPIEDYQAKYVSATQLLYGYTMGLFENEQIKSLFKIVECNDNEIVIRPRRRFTSYRDFKIKLWASGRNHSRSIGYSNPATIYWTNYGFIHIKIAVLDENDNEEIPDLAENDTATLLLNDDETVEKHNAGFSDFKDSNSSGFGYFKILTVDSKTTIYFFGAYNTDLNLVIIKTLLDTNENTYQFSVIVSNGQNNLGDGLNQTFINTTNANNKYYSHYIFKDGENAIIKTNRTNLNSCDSRTGFPSSIPFFAKGQNIGLTENKILYPFQEKDTIIQNIYYMDGGNSLGTLVPTKCIVDGDDYYVFLANIIAKNSPVQNFIFPERNNDEVLFPKIIVNTQIINTGSQGIYLIVRNTSLSSNIKLDVEINGVKTKELIAYHRNAQVTPNITFNEIEWSGTCIFGEWAYLIKGNPGDVVNLIYSTENDLALLKHLSITSISDVYENTFFTKQQTLIYTLYVYMDSSTSKYKLYTNPTTEDIIYIYSNINLKLVNDMYQEAPLIYFLSKNLTNTIPKIYLDDDETTDYTNNFSITLPISFKNKNQEIENWYLTVIDFGQRSVSYTAFYSAYKIHLHGTPAVAYLDPITTQEDMLAYYQRPYLERTLTSTDINYLLGPCANPDDQRYLILRPNEVGKRYCPEGIINFINLIQDFQEEESNEGD